MATTTDSEDNATSAGNDISALQKEVARLKKLIAAQSAEAYYEMRDRAGKVYEDAAPKAKNAVAQVRAEGATAVQVAREHPAAATTALLLAGTLGFIAGYLVAGESRPEPQPRYWWR